MPPGTDSLISTTRVRVTPPLSVAAVTPIADSPSAGPLPVATEDSRGDGGKTTRATTVRMESLPTDLEISDPTYYLLKYLRFASFPNLRGDPEFAVIDFARELLRALGFQTRTGLLLTRYPMAFLVGREVQVARPDISLFGTDNGMILMLVQTDRLMASQCDVENRLVTSAIAAFAANNEKLYDRNKPALTEIGVPRDRHGSLVPDVL